MTLRRPTRHPHDRDILRLAVPALGALVAEPLYVLADTAVVGHLGTQPLAALAIASSVLLTLYAVFIFLAYGTTASVARRIGAGDERGAAAEGVQGIWLALGIGVVLALIGLPLARPALGLLGAEGEIAVLARRYLVISLLGVPALLAALAGTGYLRGKQDTRTPLIVTAVTALANLVIELVLIHGLGFGIGASALSTVVAQTGGAAAYLTIVLRDVRRRSVPLRPDVSALRRLARVGVDLVVRTAALRATLVVATAVAARIGAVPVAAHQVAFELWSFLALILDAVAIAGQALVARLLGAGDAAGARAASRRMVQWGVVLGSALALVVAAGRGVLPRLFSPDPDVIALTAFLLLFVAALQPLNAVVFALDGVLIGAGDVRYLALAMVAAAALVVPLLVGVALAGWGIGWVWAALALFMVARAAGLTVRFASDDWMVTGTATPGRRH